MSSWAFVTRRRTVRLIVITAALGFGGCRMPFFQGTAGTAGPNAAGGTGVYLFSSSPEGGFYVGKSIDGVTWEKVTQTTPLPKADAPYSFEVTLRAPEGRCRCLGIDRRIPLPGKRSGLLPPEPNGDEHR